MSCRRHSRFSLSLGSIVGPWLLAMVALAPVSQGQVIANPNQIVGDYQFTNTDPTILSLLAGTENGILRGLHEAQIVADSLGGGQVLSHQVIAPSDDSVSGSYELTVEAGPPGSGIAYEVQVIGRLFNSLHRYYFTAQTPSPVEEEPAADVEAHVSECVGLLDIQWQDNLGQPVQVRVRGLDAFRSDGRLQAVTSYLGNRQQVYLAVHGDGDTYDLEVAYETGGSIFVDSLVHAFETSVAVACDTIVPVIIPVPEGDGDLGRIIGQVDILGEIETLTPTSTSVSANSGPFGNRRIDHIDADPSSGPFDLPNLLPSNATTPPEPYDVTGAFVLRSGRQLNYFNTENVSVEVTAGTTIDLGNTLVIDPGYINGDVHFAGPPSQNGITSCIADLYRSSDDDSDGDGIPNDTRRNSSSLFRAMSGNNAGVRSEFAGAFDAVSNAFVGSYEMVVGRVGNQPANWDSRGLTLRLLDENVGDPLAFQDSWLAVRNTTSAQPPSFLGPGDTAVIDRSYCFSQVNLSFHALNGQFFEPKVTHGSHGAFDGIDFTGQAAEYTVAVASRYVEPTVGTPLDAASAADEGQVTLCLPQGDYTFLPAVNTVGSNGSVSSTELPAVDVSVGCRQIIDVDPELQLALDSLPLCSTTDHVSLSGSADSDVAVAEIAAIFNGAAPQTLCTDCGVDPTFTYAAQLAQCSNELQISATDSVGNTAAVSVTTHFDQEAPSVDGCADLQVEIPIGDSGAYVDLTAVQAADACDGSLVPQCDGPADGFFPLGSTSVSCTATDLCGNADSCTFTVTVEEEGDGHTECFEDDFPGALDGGWNVAALGDAQQVAAQVIGGALQVTGTGTTYYHGSDNGAFVYRSVDGDFRAEVDITDVPVDLGGTYRKGSLTVRSGLDPFAPRVTIQFIPHYPTPDVPALQFDVRGNDGVARTLASTVQNVALPVRVAIEKRGDQLTVYYSTDGGASWNHPLGGIGGTAAIDFGPQPALVGMTTTSYDASQAMTVEYDDFTLCQPSDDPPSDPSTVPCNDDPPIDLVYLMDISGSMDRDFESGISKAEAARQTILRLNQSFALRGDGSRAALITFAGPLFANDASQLTSLVAGFTADFTAFDAAVVGLDLSDIQATDTTPSSHALERARQLLIDDGSATHRKVVLWITDSLPNIDDDMGGPGAYTEAEVAALTLHDGLGGFLPRGVVAWSGNFNLDLATYDGEVLADAMAAIEDLQGLDGDLRIHGIVPRGDGVSTPVLPEDLLDYAAFLTQGSVVGGQDLDGLLDQMPGLLQDVSCGENGTAAMGGHLWQDDDADGQVDGGEGSLSGVTVRLLDDQGALLATATTGGDGRYQFIGAEPGTYTLEVDVSTLPAGIDQATFDADGIATLHRATLTVAGYDVVDDLDFGYRSPLP